MTRVLSVAAIAAAATGGPARDRLGNLLAEAGCRFHDDERRLVAAPAVGLLLVGGVPAADFPDIREAARATLRGMGLAATMSYLTAQGSLEETAHRTVAEHGHASVAHVVQVSLLVAGVTCAVENEFNSQRDLVHMARITEARTAVQSRPPVVVPDPSLLDAYRTVLAATDAVRETLSPGDRDCLEAANLLYPAAKATAFVVSGTLRNYQKLLAAEGDRGKEAEYRRALGLMRECLAGLWPLLFPGARFERVQVEG